MNCHGANDSGAGSGGSVLLVGNPNVGKSALFAALTGRYVAVSNYPGTTVELARGRLRDAGAAQSVIDTPGVQSLVAVSEDERVARDIVLDEPGATVVQVADAKNLRRGLLLTLELAAAGTPMVLALNMTDEAEARGIEIDAERLSSILGCPVVPTVAVRRRGVPELIRSIRDPAAPRVPVDLGDSIDDAAGEIAAHLPVNGARGRGLALLLLAGDDDVMERLHLPEEDRRAIGRSRARAGSRLGEPLAYALNRRRLLAVDDILRRAVRRRPPRRSPAEALGRLAMHPVAGWPILGLVLVALYLFVGRFGAVTLVGGLEERLFGELVNPWARDLATDVIPFDLLRDFLVGPYGLVTMALTYGLAIILPIVATFFLAFGVLEDSGYLPRLAVMLDRAFRRMGLNGRAVLPMVLGLGCVTMATMTTRVLETRKERLQVTLLLALAIPCSAQLGVVLGMLGETGPAGAAIWGAILVASLLAVGYLAARVIPGAPSDFVLELPPLRRPSVRNVTVKTATRMEWYLREVIPVFILGTAILFALDRVGLLDTLERAASPIVVGWLGLPAAVTGVLLIGFLRRDYGAAGLFALAQAGALTPAQMLVALVVITLFVPCIASVLVIVREHGVKTAVAMLAFVFPFAIAVGGLLRAALGVIDVPLG